jgi:hypothetical protein
MPRIRNFHWFVSNAWVIIEWLMSSIRVTNFQTFTPLCLQVIQYKYVIGAGGGTRTEKMNFFKIHYSVITHQLLRKNHFITNEHQ